MLKSLRGALTVLLLTQLDVTKAESEPIVDNSVGGTAVEPVIGSGAIQDAIQNIDTSVVEQALEEIVVEEVIAFGITEETCKEIWVAPTEDQLHGKCITYIHPAMNGINPVTYASECPGGCAINDFCVHESNTEAMALCKEYAPGVRPLLLVTVGFGMLSCLAVAVMFFMQEFCAR